MDFHGLWHRPLGYTKPRIKRVEQYFKNISRGICNHGRPVVISRNRTTVKRSRDPYEYQPQGDVTVRPRVTEMKIDSVVPVS
ncbi:hypothetical protein BJX63DRAFT_384305 [Aspergillus granulosus]|uniref:Uncharacterized protein n=1 Tax=Aspergillus granulosus TaxID=176169 RepID=A0ABR4HSD5_9EURO